MHVFGGVLYPSRYNTLTSMIVCFKISQLVLTLISLIAGSKVCVSTGCL